MCVGCASFSPMEGVLKGVAFVVGSQDGEEASKGPETNTVLLFPSGSSFPVTKRVSFNTAEVGVLLCGLYLVLPFRDRSSACLPSRSRSPQNMT
jgi:hypothetical protein